MLEHAGVFAEGFPVAVGAGELFPGAAGVGAAVAEEVGEEAVGAAGDCEAAVVIEGGT